ncbi:MAG: hypothetical protein PVI23_14545 [Maricaulaceae bacterium]
MSGGAGSDLVGTWVNVTEAMGSKVTTTQHIRDDMSFTTTMEVVLPGGAVQTIVHEGEIELGEGTFRANYARGRTKVEGAPVPTMNVEERPLSEAEEAETRRMLDQDFPYKVESGKMTTSAQSPMGEMTIVYDKVEA